MIFFSRAKTVSNGSFSGRKENRLRCSTSTQDILVDKNINVLLAGKLTALTAPGGGETQWQAMVRYLPQTGCDARPWRPWEESLSGADVLHLFGSEPEHLPVVRAARKLGIPTVLSPIAWFDLASCWREPWPLEKRLWACGKFLARAAVGDRSSWRGALYREVDMLLPNSQAEAEQLHKFFGVSFDKIRVVPNGADPRFAEANGDRFVQRIGVRGYVLYAGRIEPRKNQLGFLRAMRGIQTPVVILGDPVPGHDVYYKRCLEAADSQVIFHPSLKHSDPLLADAYAASGCLALASWYETPGLVALEAGMSGVPLVLPRVGAAREYFGSLARYVSSENLVEIRDAVLMALTEKRNLELSQLVQDHFSWAVVARFTREVYEMVL